jgi:hypothetical protein
MQHLRHIMLLLVASAWLAGCGGVRPVAGGTPGTLSFGDQLLGDIQVSVHQLEGSSLTRIGFGVTDRDGWFELMSNGAQGALWLTPGQYRFTLESAGAPVQIPKEYRQPETTPLKISWSDADSELELKVASALSLQ